MTMPENFHAQIEAHLAELRERRRQAWPGATDRQIEYPFGRTSVTDYVRNWARERPGHAALTFGDATITYEQLDRYSDRVAAYLAHQGFEPGDRAAVMMPNCPQFIIAFLGILKAGGVHVPVNPMFRREEISYELNDSTATMAFVSDGLGDEFLVGADGSQVREIVATALEDFLAPGSPMPRQMPVDQPHIDGATRFMDLLERDDLPVPALDTDPDALAALNYTGGTTGMPKGCEHSQADMLQTGLRGGQLNFASTPDSVSLVFIPIFWIAGEDGFLIPLTTGGTCVLQFRWDADEVAAAIERHRVTVLVGTVDNYLELLERREGHDFSSLTTAVTMSFVTKLSVEVRERWARESGSPAIMRESSYGMTEDHTLDTFTLGLQDGDRDLLGRPGFTGLPMPDTDIAIVDFETRELVPIGEEGQIIVRSASMMKGYHGRPDATADTLRDGWLQTGDIGALDETGALHYLGRRKEMLKVNGMSVFPSELEFLLSRHPDIDACGVIGIADEHKGQVPLAFIQLRESAREKVSADDLVAWCRTNMATYKVPRIRVIDAVPLAPTGKVSKIALEKLAAAG